MKQFLLKILQKWQKTFSETITKKESKKSEQLLDYQLDWLNID